MNTSQTNDNKKTSKKRDNALKMYVEFSIGIVLVFTIVEFVFSTITGISHDTLTTCVYGFFGGELVMSALIKIFKIKNE